MAEFKTVIREFNRMCENTECDNCMLKSKDTACETCVTNTKHSEEVETIVMQWAAAHPIKTNRMKFREVFGKDIVITGGDDSWLDEEYKGGKG